MLLGGTNADILIDGDSTGATDSDVLDGREGGAIVSYETHTAPVSVNLATLEPAGELGEGDVLRAVFGATGGAGDDVLRGNQVANPLRGGAGDDHLYGQGAGDVMFGDAGSDRLSGGRGGDSLDGGEGDDRLLGSGGRDSLNGMSGADLLRAGPGRDTLSGGAAHCGPGQDEAYPSRERDHLSSDCELARFNLPSRRFDDKRFEVTPHPITRDAGSLTFKASCPYGDTDGLIEPLPPDGTVTLTAEGRRIARVPVSPLPPGRCDSVELTEFPQLAIRIPVALNRAGRRLLTDSRPTDVTVRFRGRNVPREPFTITLR